MRVPSAARLLLGVAFLTTPLAAQTQRQAPAASAEQRLRLLENRAALKTLVDTFSVLADRKDIARQVLLFTPDATVESISDGRKGLRLIGRDAIGKAFGAYLALFDTVYHINGQQTVTIDGDRATGVSYCHVVLIGTEGGKRIKNTSGVVYDDDYVRRNGEWLIAKRTSHFTWRDSEPIAAR